ncbi:hypothetical protein EJ02DRAFT_417473 [Clathrospora elynae]|uniref:Peptidase M12A domain-containing protein n=1 Tax=Clathrospora elynae TaxID=706981 RepID=A0A6A5T793_9PLEO|nr:hypothetical protein EJ02DRAFT_417473 [Clathrospora elynae]
MGRCDEEAERTSGGGSQGVAVAWDNVGGPIPWPRTGENSVVIPYCFVQESHLKNIRNVVENGMAKWIEYLGGDASEHSEHAISFEEYKEEQGNPRYYRDSLNVILPYETLAIKYTDGKSWGASVGLTRANPEKPWQNQIHIADVFTIIGMMHELDHAWPTNTTGPTATPTSRSGTRSSPTGTRAGGVRQAEGYQITEDGLCLSMPKALQYQCTCAAFVKGFVEPGWTIKAFTSYDMSSIMHYASYNGYTKEEWNDVERRQNCPMEGWIDWNDHGLRTGTNEQARKPSQFDVLFIQPTYP